MARKFDRFLRFPGGKAKVLTLSYDDGVEQDIRMVELLREAGVKCTFNINSGCFSPEGTVHPEGKIHRRMTASQCAKLYTDDVCEVAVHTYSHPHLPNLDSATVCCEVLDDRRALEALFAKPIHGMAYPFGPTNDTVVNALKMCGIYYSRTVVSHEKFLIPSTADEWLRLGATCHHKNPRLLELCDEFLQMEPAKNPAMFYLWGHTYEFEQANNWHVIEEFLNKMKGHEDIWYATNMDVYLAWRDFQRLESSADGSFVHNPSPRSVWFMLSNKAVFEVKPGETISLA